MNIDELTLGQIKQLTSLVGSGADDSHWQVGECYFIRAVTHHYTGRLVKVTPMELVLVDAAWIADSGRFAQCIANGTLSEVEPYPDGQEVVVGRGALVDATLWQHPLPREEA